MQRVIQHLRLQYYILGNAKFKVFRVVNKKEIAL